MTDEKDIFDILSVFQLQGTIKDVAPIGNGLINETLKVTTAEAAQPDYILQRINHQVFQDVDLLQHNIEAVTAHIRKKLLAQGETDIDRKCLRFIATTDGKTYHRDSKGQYWRVSVFIPDAYTHEEVNAESSFSCGKAFGDFEKMLVDLAEPLGETIPNFHNMELRLQQFKEAIAADKAKRVSKVNDIITTLLRDGDEMCQAERLYREGKLPKRLCHCDTKVNNMMFDAEGNVLCVIDLDTVMPSFVFSDYGDFLRTGANFVAEDSDDYASVGFNDVIFKAFTEGYLSSASSFLTPTEISLLPFAAALFPYMQCVRFLTDYLNGDTYYKIKYDEHNYVRAKNQLLLYQDVHKKEPMMTEFIHQTLKQ